MHRPKVREGRRATMTKLVQIGFTDDDRSGGVQPLDNMSIEIWNPIEQNLRSSGGAHTAGSEHVFDRERHAVKRTAMLTTSDFVISGFCLCEGLLFQNGDEGV